MEVVLAALLGALFGWAANQFLPGAWRTLTRRPVVHLYVETDPAVIWAGAPPWVGAGYVLPDVVGLGDPPSSFCPDWYSWLRPRGAVPAGSTEAEITLTSATNTTVILDGVRAKVVRRGPPPAWTHLICVVGGADITPRHIRIELDGFDVPLTSFVSEVSGERIRVPRLVLSPGQAEKFYLLAKCRSEDIEWTAELLAIVNGKRRVFAITNDGKPFRTCGVEGLPTHSWYGTGAWDPPLPA
jgi:hypothetical protein